MRIRRQLFPDAEDCDESGTTSLIGIDRTSKRVTRKRENHESVLLNTSTSQTQATQKTSSNVPGVFGLFSMFGYNNKETTTQQSKNYHSGSVFEDIGNKTCASDKNTLRAHQKRRPKRDRRRKASSRVSSRVTSCVLMQTCSQKHDARAQVSVLEAATNPPTNVQTKRKRFPVNQRNLSVLGDKKSDSPEPSSLQTKRLNQNPTPCRLHVLADVSVGKLAQITPDTPLSPIERAEMEIVEAAVERDTTIPNSSSDKVFHAEVEREPSICQHATFLDVTEQISTMGVSNGEEKPIHVGQLKETNKPLRRSSRQRSIRPTRRAGSKSDSKARPEESPKTRRSRRRLIRPVRFSPSQESQTRGNKQQSMHPSFPRRRTRSSLRKLAADPGEDSKPQDSRSSGKTSCVTPPDAMGDDDDNDDEGENDENATSPSGQSPSTHKAAGSSNNTAYNDGKPLRRSLRQPTKAIRYSPSNDEVHNYLSDDSDMSEDEAQDSPGQAHDDEEEYEDDTLNESEGRKPEKTVSFDLDDDEPMDWKDTEVASLREAYTVVDPRTTDFWGQIAAQVGSKDERACREKWFSLVKTPVAYRKVASNIGAEGVSPDDLFNATPMRGLFHGTEALLHPNLEMESPVLPDGNNVLPSVDNFEELGELPVVEPKVGYKTYLQGLRRGVNKAQKEKAKDRKKKMNRQTGARGLAASAGNGSVEMMGRLTPGGTLRVKKVLGDSDDEDNLSCSEDSDDEEC